MLFGSDFPHPEGVDDPATYAERIADLPAATVEKIIGGNLARPDLKALID